MGFFGYDKNEKLEFNNKRLCGMWLILISLVLFISILTGGNQIINMSLFSIGYFISFFSVFMNKKIINKLSYGKLNKFQKKISLYSIILLFILMSLFGGVFFATNNWRMVWLGALMATSIHFLPYYFVHGKSMIFLSVITSINIAIGYIFSDISLIFIAYIDVIIKFIFGTYLLFFSKYEK